MSDLFEARILYEAWVAQAPQTDPDEALQNAINSNFPQCGDEYKARLYSEIWDNLREGATDEEHIVFIGECMEKANG